MATAFCLDKDTLLQEWKCFRRYLKLKRDKDPKTSLESVLKELSTSDIGDAFPLTRKLANIILASPNGTANVERSFCTMNRVCDKIRQRLTPEHLNELMVISIEGPETLSDADAKEISYIWHNLHARKIQFPEK